ncbi:fibrobacter succinogenes major paralogous domain-containing protein, partial [bacterium]|nr:fibrobacter succinogenes major paralogous domain-containing protein [bacterium]
MKAESGTCWDPDGDGVCAEEEVLGCTDDNACNYSSEATENDESCIYPEIDDCGCEFDCDGNLLNDNDGDGVCDNADLSGCLDMSACNYDPNSCAEGSEYCIYGEGTPGAPCDDEDSETHFDVYDENGCSCAGEPLVDPAGSGPCEGETAVTFGETTYALVELGGHCWFRENLSSTTYANGDEIPVIEEATAWAEAADGARSAYDNALETNGFLYNWMAVADARGVCPTGWQVPSDTMWMALESDLGLPSDQTQATGLRGSTEGAALKAAPPAWNGSDAAAFTGLPEGFRTNMGNFNNSGLLGYWWSTTPDAPNHAWYRALSEFNDQIYRNIFNRRAGLHIRCVKGEQPTVCNGTPGASCDDGDPNTFNDVYDDMGCACAGTDAVELDGSGPCEGEASVNYHGHDYLLVEIGDQCWFRENLNTTSYANGDSIPGNLSDAAWGGTMTGAYSVYGDNETNLDAYGRLYNWNAASDARGLCPNGWHVPSNAEWTELTTLFGGLTSAGLHLKSSSLDTPPWNGINTSGFTARGGGRRYQNGSYSGLTGDGFWWSSSPNEANLESALYRLLNYGNGVHQGAYPKNTGFSVRCIRGCLDSDGDGLCNEDEISGCTDDLACNFNPEATDSNEECFYPGFNECGCPVGCDGEPLNFEDYWCECEIPGCQDTEACNYDPEATDSDGSCAYPEIDDCGCEFDCDGNLLNDADGDGICDNADVEGCLDMSACNYDPNSCSDGFCIYGEGTAGESCDDN